MIAFLEGTITHKEGNRIILMVGGVGLEVFIPLRVIDLVGAIGEKVKLFTYLHVREDALTIFGFLERNEKMLFQALLGVSGVGPKVALAILSVSEAGELARLIHEEKTSALMSFPGIGKKTAERIVLELKDRIDIERYLPEAGVKTPGIGRELMDEAAMALETLGMTRINAARILDSLPTGELGEDCSVEDIVREVLRRSASRK